MNDITKENYRQYDAINFSTLSAIDRDPSLLIKEQEFTEALRKGDAVDIKMFTPEEFYDKYIVSTVPQPTGQLLELVNLCFEKGLKWENEIDIESEANLQIDGKFVFFGSTKNLDKRRANWDTNLFWNYLEFLNNSKEKIIINTDEWGDIVEATEILKTHLFTKDIFNSNEFGYEVISQYPFSFEYQEYKYKGLVDLLKIDHENKTIEIYDLKTTGPGLKSFVSSIFHWKYYLQASLYYHGIQANFPEYDIKFFRDIVYSFTDKLPQIYDLTSYIEGAKEGFTDKYGNYHKGWLQLTEEYLWHKENNIWEYDKQTYENNGLIIL